MIKDSYKTASEIIWFALEKTNRGWNVRVISLTRVASVLIARGKLQSWRNLNISQKFSTRKRGGEAVLKVKPVVRKFLSVSGICWSMRLTLFGSIIGRVEFMTEKPFFEKNFKKIKIKIKLSIQPPFFTKKNDNGTLSTSPVANALFSAKHTLNTSGLLNEVILKKLF